MRTYTVLVRLWDTNFIVQRKLKLPVPFRGSLKLSVVWEFPVWYFHFKMVSFTVVRIHGSKCPSIPSATFQFGRKQFTVNFGILIQFLEWISLPDYLKSAFRIRYDDSCMDSNFNLTPLSSGCLNEIEIFILTLMLAVFLCAIISSIYYCFLANTQFRLISRSFKGMIFKWFWYSIFLNLFERH